MALVTVTFKVSDHSHVSLAGRAPIMWFKPNKPNAGDGRLLTGSRWPRADLNEASGNGSVQLDNSPEIFYTPILQYLADPSRPDSWGFDEWDLRVFPGPTGGVITDLAPTGLTTADVLVATGTELIAAAEIVPESYRGWWMDATPGQDENWIYQRRMA